MSEARARADANHCFVCGPDNPLGLRLRYRLDGEVCRASFTAGPHHGGWQDLTHGGILYSVLDDVMANWLFLKGIRGHTAKCEIRYRQPVKIGTPLELEGRLVSRRGRMAVLSGIAIRAADQVVVAETQATFMIVDEGTTARGQERYPGS